jgi:hypothetical protein
MKMESFMKKCCAVAVLRSFDFCHLMNPKKKGGRGWYY